LALWTSSIFGQNFTPSIPRAWADTAERESFELPLVRPEFSPRYLSEREYYALPVRPVYRTYPVYVPDKEPAGYWESLEQKEPEILFEPAKLKSREEWIRAGKLVFEQPSIVVPGRLRREEYLESLRHYPGGIPPSGVTQNMVYVIRKKGVVEFGVESCAECHTRVMPDGTRVAGAPMMEDQGPRGKWRMEFRISKGAQTFADLIRGRRRIFFAPWVSTAEEFDRISPDEYWREHNRPPGIVLRPGTGARHPAKIPVLIGVEGRKYLDATGLSRHRGVADMMRYAIVNQGLNGIAHFGNFQPGASSPEMNRYGDEQLYALALYIYSLKAPANPLPPNSQTRRGARVFEREGCTGCHPAPLYTNNKLTPAKGFRIPPELLKTDAILDISVGTNAGLATETRRGTGFYKVPSLNGLWLRSLYGHEGSAASLEEWFDPSRLRPDYEPKGYHYGPGPIEGHEFGLRLNSDEKAELIAFLRTL
jgi:hypothetical protein